MPKNIPIQLRKNTNANKVLFDTVMAIPDTAKHLLQEGAPQEFRFQFTVDTMRRARDVRDELVIMRDIARNDGVITDLHPHVGILAVQDGAMGTDRTTEERRKRVQETHGGWRDEAEGEALMLIMTQLTKIRKDYQPKEYDNTVEETEEDENDWEIVEAALPEPTRNLRNQYERRIKQIYDVLELCNQADPLYQTRFMETILTFGDQMAFNLGGQVEFDKAGFRPKSGKSGSD